jgi:hypothetical protein
LFKIDFFHRAFFCPKNNKNLSYSCSGNEWRNAALPSNEPASSSQPTGGGFFFAFMHAAEFHLVFSYFLKICPTEYSNYFKFAELNIFRSIEINQHIFHSDYLQKCSMSAESGTER